MLDRTPIRSASNAWIKRARRALQGRESGSVVLEGERLVDEALGRGLTAQLVFVAESREPLAERLAAAGVPVRLIAPELLASLTRLVTSPGIFALVEAPAARGLDQLVPGPSDLVVVAAGIQNPGNLGALARTAEAAGAAGLVLTAGGCGAWNEKALRGSMGSLLRLPVHEEPEAGAAWDLLSSHGFGHVLAEARDGRRPADVDWSGRVALWVFPEHGEAPPELASRRAQHTQRVTIPMRAGVESLNVTVAAAVLLYAAGRAEDSLQGGSP